ncbi:CRP1 [Sanghuangporus sanghuang]
MADTYILTFDWPHTDAHSVIVTGTFDNWSSSVHLQRTESGFTGSVAVPWDTKILYKFIVNGNWVTHANQPTETDAAGFVNNVVHTPTKPAPQPVPADSAKKEAAEPVATAFERPKKEVVEEDQPKKIENVDVAPSVPVPIQPVPDGTTDTTVINISNNWFISKLSPFLQPESKPVAAETAVSTHEAAPAPEPTPAVASSTIAPEPSTPPQKKSDLPESSPAPSPVTPIKTNGTSAPEHVRTSTGTSTPPSSLAPSTPKTSTTFPAIEGDGSPGSRMSSLGRKTRTSLFGKLKGVFRSPSKDKGKKADSRSASPSSRK